MSSTESAAKRSADADDIEDDEAYEYDERYDVDDDEDWEEEDDNAIVHGDYSDSECEEEGEEDTKEDTKEDESTGVKFTQRYLRSNYSGEGKRATTFKKVLDILENDLGVPLIKGDHVLVPLSKDMLGTIIKLNKRQMKDKATSHIYFVLRTKKTGRTTNGRKRWGYYLKKGHDKDDDIIVIFDYDYASDEVINDIFPGVLKAIRKEEGVSLDTVTKLEELDIDGVEDLEKTGLPFHVRLLIDSLSKDIDECVGGAFRIAGYERAFDLNDVESALQKCFEKMMRDDSDVNNSIKSDEQPRSNSAQHEHLHFDGISWIRLADPEVQSKADEFKQALESAVGKDWVQSNRIGRPVTEEDIIFWSSWEPNIPHGEVAATCVGYDAIFDQKNTKDIYWKDIFTGMTNKTAPYNTDDGHNKTQRRNARAKHRELLKNHLKKGGLLVLNKCSAAYDKMKEEDASADESKSLLEAVEKEGGYEKKPFFEYNGLTAWVSSDKKGVLIIHPPLCTPLFSHVVTETHTWPMITQQGDRAKVAHLLQAIVQYFINGDTIRTCKSVMGNFLFAYTMRIYLLKNLHVHSFVATLFAKNLLWKFDNVFKSEYNDLAASERGKTKRQRERGGVSHTYDGQQHAAIQNRVSKIDLNDEQSVAEGVKDVGERIKIVPSTGLFRTFSKREEMLDRLKNSYVGGIIANKIKGILKQMKEEEQTELSKKQDKEVAKEREDKLDKKALLKARRKEKRVKRDEEKRDEEK